MQYRFSPGFLGFFLPVLLSCGFSCQAQQTTSQSAAHERTLVAQSFASERLWMWQKRLNLQEWNISVVVSHPTDLKPKTLGNIHWDADKRRALIRVLDPADYHMEMPEILADLEFTVVHELIHLELASLPKSDASRSTEEYAVNQIARALLSLDHKQ